MQKQKRAEMEEQLDQAAAALERERAQQDGVRATAMSYERMLAYAEEMLGTLSVARQVCVCVCVVGVQEQHQDAGAMPMGRALWGSNRVWFIQHALPVPTKVPQTEPHKAAWLPAAHTCRTARSPGLWCRPTWHKSSSRSGCWRSTARRTC